MSTPARRRRELAAGTREGYPKGRDESGIDVLRGGTMGVTVLMLWLAGALPSGQEAERDGVRVRMEVSSGEYTWSVRNLDAEAITHFGIGHHHGYDVSAPRGWEAERDGETLRAWATDPLAAIGRGQEAAFTLRIGSSGAVLGHGELRLGCRGGAPIVIPGVWRPVPEPRHAAALTAGVITALVLLHAGLVWRRERCAAAGGAIGP